MRSSAPYGHWAVYNRLIADHLRSLPPDTLALTAGGASNHWPIWAIAGHTAGARTYWLCDVLGEPGKEGTPFADQGDLGWEDDLSTPRSGAELADAFAATWHVVAAALARWTPEMLDQPMPRRGSSGLQHHTRRSIVLRLITHEAYHAGEIALIEGIHGRTQLDLWPAGAHTTEAASTG
jgi:uncharacterized damage-inducible protein DinB